MYRRYLSVQKAFAFTENRSLPSRPMVALTIYFYIIYKKTSTSVNEHMQVNLFQMFIVLFVHVLRNVNCYFSMSDRREENEEKSVV